MCFQAFFDLEFEKPWRLSRDFQIIYGPARQNKQVWIDLDTRKEPKESSERCIYSKRPAKFRSNVWSMFHVPIPTEKSNINSCLIKWKGSWIIYSRN